MKLEILQENLNRALSSVCRVVSSRPQIPILSHLLISAEENLFTLTGSNLETTIVTPVGAKIISPGKFTVPARTFQELISSLSAEKITLAVEENLLTVSAGQFKAKINGTAASEYPKLYPELKGSSFWDISPEILRDAVAKTIFAAAVEEGKAVLTGILFEFSPGKLSLVATDGFRLSLKRLNRTSSDSSEKTLIIPAKTLLEVGRVLAENPNVSTKLFLLAESQVLFAVGDVQIYSQVISGKYPDFEKIIPTKTTIKAKLTTGEFLQAIRTASIFARESANVVKLKLDKTGLTVSANAPEVGENETRLEPQWETPTPAEEFSIAFNFHYLLDFLNVAEEKSDILLEFSGAIAPGVFRSTADKDFLYLVMPVRVQS